MTPLPPGGDVYIDCGSSKEYDTLDEDGNPTKIRFIARPAAPAGGGPPAVPQPRTTGTPGGGIHLPDVGHGAAAQIVTVVTDERGRVGPMIDADLVLHHDLAPKLPAGFRQQVPMWPMRGTPGAQVTLVLPEKMTPSAGGAMIFIPGLGDR